MFAAMFQTVIFYLSIAMVTGMSDLVRIFYRKSLPVDLKSGLKFDFPYKIFVYNLPPLLNTDIVKEIIQTDYITKGMMSGAGLGREIFKMGKYDDISVRDTFPYNLEMIMHQKMLNSPYRTLNPDEADLFYVPAYSTLRCVVKDKDCQSCQFNKYLSALVSFLHLQPGFKEKKPHFSAVGNIHRELASFDCPYLLYPVMKDLHFFAIEKENVGQSGVNLLVNQAAQSLVVVPYPSYIHFTGITASVSDFGYKRDVFALLPISTPEESALSGKLSAQFNRSTSMSYGKYFRTTPHQQFDMVEVNTEGKDHEKMIRKTISWMSRSIFCLHPPGASSTKRSFYDALLCGCIPVIFIDNAIPYAFASSIDYSKFSVAIKESDIVQKKNVGDILKTISSNIIKQLQRNVDLISQRMQYSVQKSNVPDAVDLALLEMVRLIEAAEKSKDKKAIKSS